MQYIFFGHDFRYLEFFENIRQSLAKKNTVTFVFSRWGPFCASRNISEMEGRSWYLGSSEDSYRMQDDPEIDFRFYQMHNFDKAKMTALFKKYVSKFMSILPKTTPPFVLMPGEYRLSEQALKFALETRYGGQAKVLYFESGPPGYIYLSPYGTNAKSNFDNLVANLVKNSNQAFGPGSEASNQYRVEYRAVLQLIDYIHIVFNRFAIGRLDYQEYIQAVGNYMRLRLKRLLLDSSKIASSSQNFKGHSPIILFCGQVRSDVNHTHFGVAEEQVVTSLEQLLNGIENAAILVRHHPLYVNSSLETSLKERFGSRVMDSTSSSITRDIERSDGVVTVNSNSGIEALMLGKPVYLLGRSYYEDLPGVTKDIESFRAMMSKNSDASIKKAIVDFLSDYFLNIDYRNGNFSKVRLASFIVEKF